jgi:hypothetical protein
MNNEHKKLMAEIAEFTKESKFVKPRDIVFIRSDRNAASLLDKISTQLIDSINSLVEIASKKPTTFNSANDINENFSLAGDTIDTNFEKTVSFKLFRQSFWIPKITKS